MEAVAPLLADVVVIVHFLFVSFVVGGLALIWIGRFASWKWIRNFWFRAAHLAAIAFVACEALLGIMCPLTIWEDALRGTHEEKSFIARWVHRAMFYDFPEWVFTAAYVSFALVVALTYWRVLPDKRAQK